MADDVAGFAVPSRAELLDRIQTDINSRVDGADSRLTRTLVYGLSFGIAGMGSLYLRFLRRVLTQSIYDKATGAFVRRWARIHGLEPLVATKATGLYTFTGVAASPVPTGTEVQRGDLFVYVVDAPGGNIAGGGSVELAITAVEFGADGNAVLGTLGELVSPQAGVDPDGSVTTADIVDGTDDETGEALRERLLLKLRQAPQGGAGADYDLWAREALVGINRVGVTSPAPGEVLVRFSMVVPTGGAPIDAIPDPGQVATVDDYIREVDAFGHTVRLPVHLNDPNRYMTLAPTGLPVDITAQIEPNTMDVQEAAEAELKALFEREGNPEGGGEIPNSEIRGAITNARDETKNVITDINGDGTGLSDITPGVGFLAHLGTVTWV